MNKRLLLGVFALLFVFALASLSSAYYYDNDQYKRQYQVKESYTRDGYTYTEKNLNQDPYGSVTTTKRIQEYDTPRGDYRYYAVSNEASDYFEYGSSGPYSYSAPRHLGYGWDDSWRREVYDSQYHPYYYEPRYNGQYWDWQYDYGNPRCYTNCRW